MSEIIARFADGRMLVTEERRVETRYITSTGVPLRIAQVRHIEKVLSIDTDYSQHGIVTNLSEVTISGAQIGVRMRRGEQGYVSIVSGQMSGLASISGASALNMVSGLTSGIGWMSELLSGNICVSGIITVKVNMIAE